MLGGVTILPHVGKVSERKSPMALAVRELNKTQTVMNENVSYFLDYECELDVEGLATFGLDHGDVKEIGNDENQLYLWALQIRDILDGRAPRATLIREI
jgi:hypothetical protein